MPNICLDADDERTWPPGLVGALEAHLPANLDDAALYGEPEAIDVIQAALPNTHICGYHATRLTARETLQVEREGLRLASQDLVRAKVDACVASGELTPELGVELTTQNLAKEDGSGWHTKRTGRLCFASSPWAFKHETSSYRFFLQWGGEVLHFGHADDSERVAALRTIGTACIVQVEIPIAHLGLWSTAKDLLRSFIDRRSAKATPWSWEMHIEHPISPERVRKIVSRGNPEFARLTCCDGCDGSTCTEPCTRWEEPPT
jgi:hypothetical protein